MAKKGNLPLIYLIGMALVVIGFFCPMYKFMGTHNGFGFIDFDHFGFVTIGAFLLFIGGVVGLVGCFINLKAIDLKWIGLIAAIVGALVLVIGCFSDSFYKAIGKSFLKNALVGFYMVVVGVIAAAVGKFMK